MRIQVYRWEGRWKTQCDVNCYRYACFRKSKSYVNTRCFTVNTPHSPFAVAKQWKLSAQTCPHMSKVTHGGVHVNQTSAEMRLFW